MKQYSILTIPNRVKVCILLSTYNGEKYLEEQLDSLVKQESVDIDILVRDDGSTDGTTNILNKWQNKGYLKWYSGKNKGYALSFMDLVQNSGEYDFYAFCDQDDIWLPKKLISAIDKLEELKSPVKLYCSNLYYYKNGENFGLIKKQVPRYDIYTSIIQNIAAGCTIVFNRELKNIMTQCTPNYLIAHDFWAYQVAMIFGEVYHDENSYIYYRQHDNNQIGAKTSIIDKWERRIKRLFSKKTDGRAAQAQELLRCYSNELSIEKQNIISLVANYNNIWTRAKLFFDNRYTMGSTIGNILFRIKIIFGKL